MAAVRDATERLASQAEQERLRTEAERDRMERQLQQSQRLESLGQLAGGEVVLVVEDEAALREVTRRNPGPQRL